VSVLTKGLDQIGNGGQLKFAPRITPLQMVQPWKYRSWNRKGEATKPISIPEDMQG
jgi:hypothetical protein